MDGMLISIIVFLVVYTAITFELVNKAVAAFSGVAILVLLKVISPHIPGGHSTSGGIHAPSAIMLIDYETIMLLFGMMIIVSECHIHKIPILLFLKTLKFSHYPATEQNILKNSFQDIHDGVEYSFSIHSNDIIKLELIDHIITEKGEISTDDVTILREQVADEY